MLVACKTTAAEGFRPRVDIPADGDPVNWHTILFKTRDGIPDPKNTSSALIGFWQFPLFSTGGSGSVDLRLVLLDDMLVFCRVK